MNRIVFDESRAPSLYVVRFEGVQNDADFDEYLNKMTKIAQQTAPRALVVDATLAGQTPASQRKRQAEWMKKNAMATRTTVVGMAFVLPSAFSRGVLTAILWLQPLPCPHAIFATTTEAVNWAEERLREREQERERATPVVSPAR